MQRSIEESARYHAYTENLAHHILYAAPPQSKLSLLVSGKGFMHRETSVPLGNGQLWYKPVDLTAPLRQCYLPPSLMGTRPVTTVDPREAKYVVHKCDISSYFFEQRTIHK